MIDSSHLIVPDGLQRLVLDFISSGSIDPVGAPAVGGLERVSEVTLRNSMACGDIQVARPDVHLSSFRHTKITTKMLHHVLSMVDATCVVPSGNFHYPPGGFMGWHTNSDAPYTRLYIVYADEGDKSFFRYYDQHADRVITVWDKRGFNVYLFNTPPAPNLFWHAVYSDCNRYSFGYRIIQ